MRRQGSQSHLFANFKMGILNVAPGLFSFHIAPFRGRLGNDTGFIQRDQVIEIV
jgi:hypothetical protein